MSWAFGGKPSVVGAASGAVAGLVAITPAAGFVSPLFGIVIGWILGSRAARDAFAAELRRREERAAREIPRSDDQPARGT